MFWCSEEGNYDGEDRCIDSSYLCNGYEDCDSGQDELPSLCEDVNLNSSPEGSSGCIFF